MFVIVMIAAAAVALSVTVSDVPNKIIIFSASISSDSKLWSEVDRRAGLPQRSFGGTQAQRLILYGCKHLRNSADPIIVEAVCRLSSERTTEGKLRIWTARQLHEYGVLTGKVADQILRTPRLTPSESVWVDMKLSDLEPLGPLLIADDALVRSAARQAFVRTMEATNKSLQGEAIAWVLEYQKQEMARIEIAGEILRIASYVDYDNAAVIDAIDSFLNSTSEAAQFEALSALGYAFSIHNDMRDRLLEIVEMDANGENVVLAARILWRDPENRISGRLARVLSKSSHTNVRLKLCDNLANRMRLEERMKSAVWLRDVVELLKNDSQDEVREAASKIMECVERRGRE